MHTRLMVLVHEDTFLDKRPEATFDYITQAVVARLLDTIEFRLNL